MSRHIRRFGPYFLLFATLVGLSMLLVPTPEEVRAASYTSPFWTSNASTLECPCSTGCNRPPTFSPEGVSYLTTEFVLDQHVLSVPGRLEPLSIGLRWRSMMSGVTQLGRGVLPSWEWTLKAVDSSTKEIRRPDGLIETWTLSGGSWGNSDCSSHGTLTDKGSGVFERADLQSNAWLFDGNGMPDKYTDRNGNAIDFSYNSSYELTSLTDTRGKSWTFHHDSEGFIDYVDDPSSRRFTFDYDTNGNLIQIGFPATTDQPLGTTIDLGYDTSNRLTSYGDRRGNTTHQFAYSSTTGKIDTVTIGSDDVTFSRQSGRTDRTDRNGNVHRIHFTGRNITKTEMWINSASEYATTFGYSGSAVTHVVLPRGNRIDYTYNGDDEMTERRRKTTNTSSTSSSDIVESWTWSNHFIASHTDAEGETTDLTRDTNGNVTRIDYPDVTNPVSQTANKTITYNSYGQVTQVTDEEGKVVQASYYSAGDDVGLLEKVEVDPTGLDLETTYGYDSYWNVDSVADARGNATTKTFDALRRLKQRTSPSPLSIDHKWEYDGNGNVEKHEIENLDEDGDSVKTNPWITTTYTWTTLDQLSTIVEEIDASSTRVTSFDYDANGNRVRVTKPEGNREKWTFNERNLVASHVRGENDPDASTTDFLYDDNGNLHEVEDGRGNVTTNTFDLFDRRTRTTDALGHYVQFTINKRGQATKTERKSSSDTVLARSSSYYDARGRLWKRSDLREDPGTTYSDAVTKIERFKTGHVKKVTDARGKSRTTSYDNAWRRTSVADAMGNIRNWTLDANGNATSWDIQDVDGQGSVTHEFEATYDVLNRRITQVEIDRTDGTNELRTTFGRDSRGNVTWLVNAEGNPTRWTFDAAGRMTKKEVALSTGTSIEDFTSAMVTEWDFDDNNRLTSHKDDAGNETTWQHDALDRPTKVVYPNLDEVRFDHDANDNIIEIIDAAGNDIDDVFDANNRRTSRTITLASGFLGTTSETMTYDAMGRLKSAADNDYKVEFTYGTIGLSSQIYEEKQSYVGGSTYTKTVKKTYDAVGNVITELYPSGLDLDRTWNDINKLVTVTDGTDTIASYSYVGPQVNKVTYESGATATTTYTGFRGEIARVHHETSSPTTILDLQYDYDDNHERLYERYGGSSASGDAFGYDWGGRLTTAHMGSVDVTAPSSSAYTEKIDYLMDDDGNRTGVGVTPYGQSPTSTQYTDNNLNQYASVGSTSHTYDDNGNLTYDGTNSYEYDYRNQIVRVKQGTTTIAEYLYDALGRRVEKDDQTSVERYIYSGSEMASVYTGAQLWKQDFVFGQVVGEVLMLEQADVLDYDGDSNTTETTRSFYHRNALGSVMEITDMNEAVAVSYRYDPFGAVTITHGGSPQSSDPLGNPWMFGNYLFDEATNLYTTGRGNWSPALGRLSGRDAIGLFGGSNLYQAPIDAGGPARPNGGGKGACVCVHFPETYTIQLAAGQSDWPVVQQCMDRVLGEVECYRFVITCVGDCPFDVKVFDLGCGTPEWGGRQAADVMADPEGARAAQPGPTCLDCHTSEGDRWAMKVAMTSSSFDDRVNASFAATSVFLAKEAAMTIATGGLLRAAGYLWKGGRWVAGAIRSGGRGAAAGDDGVTIYRAVSAAEKADVGVAGLRVAPGSYEIGKLFATTADDAGRWACDFGRKFGDKDIWILTAKIPKSLAAQLETGSDVGRAFLFAGDDLLGLINKAAKAGKAKFGFLDHIPVP